jgi:hypothetical protein
MDGEFFDGLVCNCIKEFVYWCMDGAMGNGISLRKIREAGCKMCDDVFGLFQGEIMRAMRTLGFQDENVTWR